MWVIVGRDDPCLVGDGDAILGLVCEGLCIQKVRGKQSTILSSPRANELGLLDLETVEQFLLWE